MTKTPYPIGGIVYDMNGSTALANVTVTARDYNLEEQVSTTTNASGEYLLDLANLTSEYSNNDVIYLTAIIGTTKYEHYRTTVNTTTGYETKNLTLRAGRDPYTAAILGSSSSIWLYAGTISNTDSGTRFIDLYEAASDRRLVRIYAAATSSHSFNYGKIGLQFNGGILVLDNATGGISTEKCMVTLVI